MLKNFDVAFSEDGDANLRTNTVILWTSDRPGRDKTPGRGLSNHTIWIQTGELNKYRPEITFRTFLLFRIREQIVKPLDLA